MRTKTIFLVSLSVIVALGIGLLIGGRTSRPSAVGSATVPVAVVGGTGLPAEAGVSPVAVPSYVARAAGLPAEAGVSPVAVALSTAVPQRVRAIVGAEGDGRLGTRLGTLDQLGKNLTAEEQRAICRFLLDRSKRGEHLTPAQDHVLVNDVLKALRLQQEPLPELTDVMLALYRDPAEDVVVRDYALQLLSEWYERAPDRQRIVPVLWEAVGETDSTIAGTALLALSRLSGAEGRARPPGAPQSPVTSDGSTGAPLSSSGAGGSGSTPTAASAPSPSTTGIDRSRLAQAALRLAADERCGIAARVTALQVCARLDVREAGAVARQLAESAEILSLRVSAIAALGALGGADSVEFLEQLAAGSDVRLYPAARAALQRVRSRLGGQA